MDENYSGGLRMEITHEDYAELEENFGYGDYLESW